MNKIQQVIGIRCHHFGEPEQFLYDKLRQYFDKNAIFFIVDELKEPKLLPENLNKVSLSTDFLEKNKLYSQGRVAWACGDYFYYVFRQQVEAEHYWLIEPDVLLNLDSSADFFGFFVENTVDALVMNFGKAPEKWTWYQSAKNLLDPPYRCFFPLTRLSKSAVDVMYKKRQAISADYLAEKYTGQFPNDEALLANALMEQGIEPINLSSYFPEYFDDFSIVPSKNRKLSMEFCHNQIIHPVKTLDFYKNQLSTNIYNFFNKGLIHSLSHSTLDDEEHQELTTYSIALFRKNLLEGFGANNFTLQKMFFSFKEKPIVNLKRVMRTKNALTFFMGQGNRVTFAFEPESILAYKQVYLQPNAEPVETLLATLPIELLSSFEALKAEITQILQEHEIKKGALKQKLSQASSV